MISVMLKWIKCNGSNWCSLESVNLDHDHFENLGGVYVIFYCGKPGKVVRVGQGWIADRIEAHRGDPAITRHAHHDLLVTWAEVPSHQRDGVERYLADTFSPLEGDRFPDARPIPVNSPFK